MTVAFPWLRWVAVVWLVVWIPAYWRVWSAANFLHICDVTVVLTCLGLWTGSSLLLSSQGVGAILTNLAWCLDAGWRLVFGHHLVGGTEYMWDAQYPLWVRLLSLFHIVLPVLLVWTITRVGYDRRGLGLQTAITAGVLVVSRLFSPALNLNYAYRDPIFQRAWGPAPVHLAVMLAGYLVAMYWPTHRALLGLLAGRRTPRQ